MQLTVRKRNGLEQQFNIDKLTRIAKNACRNLSDVSHEEITNETISQLYNGISTDEILKALILTTKAKIEAEPNYSYVASRLLLCKIYKEALPAGKASAFNRYNAGFIQNINTLVEHRRLAPEMLDFDLDFLATKIQPNRDFKFKYIGLQTLYDRYFLCVNGRRLETPQTFWMRVAMGLSLKEKNKEKRVVEFYNVMSRFLYCPGTPTLFNSGTCHPQLSSCYLSTIDDSLHGIFGTLHDQASLSKFAGGLGVDLTNLRGCNSEISSTGGMSSGLIPWMKLYNDMLIAVDQGGRRKGSGAFYCEPWHIDIEDFIDAKKPTGDERRICRDMNTALWIPDEFMKRVENNESWYMFSPSDVPGLHTAYGEEFTKLYNHYIKMANNGQVNQFKVMPAKTLMKKIITSLFETGHPWLCFKDISNIRYTQKALGVINSSNLCTEIFRHTIATLYDTFGTKEKIGETAVCNLGSPNLSAHVTKGTINHDRLNRTCKTAMRMLDNVIDLGFYPTHEAKNSNMKHRPVGLGLMGLTDAMRKLKIRYDSEEGVKFAGEIQEEISYYAIKSSIELARERGTFETYTSSEWAKGILPFDNYPEEVKTKQNWYYIRHILSKYGIRNASILAGAPTATISYITGCSQSGEPDFSVLHVYSTLSGEFTMANEFFVKRAKKLGIWGPELLNAIKNADGDLSNLSLPQELKEEFACAFAINHDYIIDMVAERQKFVDMGISMNIYCNHPSMKYLYNIYMRAWKKYLKSTYYLRSEAVSSVEKSSVNKEQPKVCSLEPGCESCQ